MRPPTRSLEQIGTLIGALGVGYALWRETMRKLGGYKGENLHWGGDETCVMRPLAFHLYDFVVGKM